MKTPLAILFAILSVTFTLSLTGCASTGQASERPALLPETAEATVEVTGMSCPMCANNITRVMDRSEAIDQSRVDLGAGMVYLSFHEGQTLTADQIKQTVDDAGFTAGAVTFKAKAGE